MIRLIQRKLIIPRGDTGSFSIPTLCAVSEGDIAVFSIYDPMTKSTIFEKEIPASAEQLTIPFIHDDTKDLPPGRYHWDITLYCGNLVYENDENDTPVLVSADEVNSYYAAYSPAICEIRESAKDQNVISHS